MASSENGATYASPTLQRAAASTEAGFDSDERGLTRLTAGFGRLPASALTGFDADDNGATRAATPHVALPRPPATATTYYKMRALDMSCAPAKTYRTWVVTGSPDATGAQYSGTHCGASINFTDIVVEDTWQV